LTKNLKAIEWVVVRSHSFIVAERVTEYDPNKSPTRTAILDAGQMSRINEGKFTTGLISEEQAWDHRKSTKPVIYTRRLNQSFTLVHALTASDQG
jgi:hypothetical protein